MSTLIAGTLAFREISFTIAVLLMVQEAFPETVLVGHLIREYLLHKTAFTVMENQSVVGFVTKDPRLISGDPRFTEPFCDGTLRSDSPCINAGPPDPQYNDRDGSRNDIGMFGGHNFIPDGRTTNKPIVLGLDVAPIAVPVGFGYQVTIESTGATVNTNFFDHETFHPWVFSSA